MSSPTVEDGRTARPRRRSAIVQADLSGYVRLMEGGEDRTVNRLKSVRAEIWLPAVDAAGGRIVNIVGDSVLAEFSSAVSALAAAIDIQERMARFNEALDDEQRLMFRIGLHVGEVIVDETETIFGDAVNVANRIQLMAEPGGIAASQEIRDATHLLADCTFVDGGKHRARHVRRPLQIYYVHRRESASGALARRPRVTIRRPGLWGAIAAAMVLFAGSGYLAFTMGPSASVSTAALTLTAEQLEQALAERRRADALAAEKRQLEAQARQRADAEAEAKRRADVELATARQARQKAERELAQLKADIEMRRQAEGGRDDQAAVMAQRAAEEADQLKAEAEATALREAEEAAAKKAEADAAKQQQADQALAMATDRREQAEAEARAAAAKAAPTLPTPKEQAEIAEKDLRLEPADRRRLQVALTSLGFDTRGDDGVLGPRSREMIANWQKARNQPSTGFVTKAQRQALLQESAAALPKAKEDIPPTVEASAAPPASPSESTDGLWRGTYECGRNGNTKPFTLKPEVRLQAGNGTWYTVYASAGNDNTLGISVAIDGTKARVTRRTTSSGGSISSSASPDTSPLLGWLEGNAILASDNKCTMVLTRDGAPVHPPIVRQPIAATYDSHPSLPSPDGLWRGTYKCDHGQAMEPHRGPPFVIDLNLRLTNGSATSRTAGPSQTNGYSFDVAVSVIRNIANVTRTLAVGSSGVGSRATLTGRYDGATISATGKERSGRDCTLALTRS